MNDRFSPNNDWFWLLRVSESLCSPDLSTADPALLTWGVWTGLLAVSLISCSCCAAGLCGDRLSSSMILTSAETGPGTGGGGGSLSVKPSLGLGLLDTVPKNRVQISKRNSNIVISYLHFYSILPLCSKNDKINCTVLLLPNDVLCWPLIWPDMQHPGRRGKCHISNWSFGFIFAVKCKEYELFLMNII